MRIRMHLPRRATLAPVSRLTRCSLLATLGQLIILLAGGDKSTQTTDIETALRLARNLSEQPP